MYMKKAKTSATLYAALLTLTLALSGCGGSSSAPAAGSDSSQSATESTENAAPLTGAELLMQSTLLIPGDSIPIRFKTDEFTYSYSKDLSYTVSDEGVASVSYDRHCESYVVTANAPGTAQISGSLEGKGGSLDVTVVEVDSASGVTLTPDVSEIDLTGGAASVSLTLEGQAPGRYVARYYTSPMLMLSIDGSLDGQTLNLTISDIISYGDGYLTVLFTDEAGTSVLAAAKVDVKVS